MFKRLLTLTLAMLMIFGMFTACGVHYFCVKR